MTLDPKLYALADQPWTYQSVAALMTVWGYAPIGDHTPSYLFNREGFLKWTKIDPKAGVTKAFAIQTPAWRANGFSQPVWPARFIIDALRRQEVCQQTGLLDNEIPFTAAISVSVKDPTIRSLK